MKLIFDEITANYFYDELNRKICSENESRKKLFDLFSLFNQIIKSLTSNEQRLFSTNYARLIYVLNKYNISGLLANNIKIFRYQASQSRKDKSYLIKKEYIDSGIYSIANLIKEFSASPLPEYLVPFIKDIKESKDNTILTVENKLLNIKCTVSGKSDSSRDKLYCQSEEIEDFTLVLNDFWQSIFGSVWQGCTLNILSAYYSKDKKQLLVQSKTIIVVEPDYLINVTDIAECFLTKSQNNINIFFLKRFANSNVSVPMVIGNLVNHIFDELLINPDVEFDGIIDTALKYKPLQIYAIAQSIDSLDSLMPKLKGFYLNLRKIIKEQIQIDDLSIEPTFISPEYGLQGRLDALIEHSDNQNAKDIIELKSGTPPTGDLMEKTLKGNKYAINMWPNHFAQVTCYNLLLDSTFAGRIGSSEILYAGTEKSPIRDAPNVLLKKQEVMKVRNRIISNEYAISIGIFNILDKINISSFGSHPPYLEKSIADFFNSYTKSDKISKLYFLAYLQFIQKELFVSKLGDMKRDGKGFSSLWLDDIEEKKTKYLVLADIKLSVEESDFDNYHLSFIRGKDNNELSALRKGDLAILYPIIDHNSTGILKNQIIKCTIKDINPTRVIVSFRNKQFNKSFFEVYENWALEGDYIDVLFNKMFNSIFGFLQADKNKRDLLLGLAEPQSEEFIDCEFPELNENQYDIVSSAIKAKDYYLIQGPPGTGKTTYVLKNIVQYIYQNTKDNILILAYTNRAVDEICSSLKKIDDINFEFLRMGSKENSEHKDVLISALSEKISLEDLFHKINNCRVFVSTVASVLTSPELMYIKDFGIAVVDEATQILEPQIIGILTKVKKFIMIGDEKQLPAIISQNQNNFKIEDELSENIHLNNLGMSLFERLLICSKNNQWSNAYGLLIKQARMHFDIQEFPNKYFYNNKLETFNSEGWQHKINSIFSIDAENILESRLSKSKILFIPSIFENKSKVNISEAQAVNKILNIIKTKYGNNFSGNTVGIISPFRAQCAEIYRYMDTSIKDKVIVDTVERFQGSERDIIIISLAINSEYEIRLIESIFELDNLKIDRKLNVALTRAREHLVILGNELILSRSEINTERMESRERSSLSLMNLSSPHRLRSVRKW